MTVIGYNSGGYDYFRNLAPYRLESRIKFDGTDYVPNSPLVDPLVKPRLASEVEKGNVSQADLVTWMGSPSKFQIGRDRGLYRRAGAASATDVKIPLLKVVKTCVLGVMGYCTSDLTDNRRMMTIGVDDLTPGVGIDPTLFMLSYFPAWRVHTGETIQQLSPPLPNYPNDVTVGQAHKFFNPETVVSKGTVVYLYLKNDIQPPDANAPFDPDNLTGADPITEGDITFEFYASGYSTEQYNNSDPGGKYAGEDKVYGNDFGPIIPLF